MTTTETIFVFFGESTTNAALTGLSPTIDIWNLTDSSQAVFDDSMTEIGGGFYSYSYASFDSEKTFGWVVDGGAEVTLRYKSGTSTGATYDQANQIQHTGEGADYDRTTDSLEGIRESMPTGDSWTARVG